MHKREKDKRQMAQVTKVKTNQDKNSFLMSKQDFPQHSCTALGQMPESVESPPMEILRTQLDKDLTEQAVLTERLVVF